MMQMEWCNQFDSRVRIEGAAKHEGRFFNLLVQFQPLLTRPAHLSSSIENVIRTSAPPLKRASRSAGRASVLRPQQEF